MGFLLWKLNTTKVGDVIDISKSLVAYTRVLPLYVINNQMDDAKSMYCVPPQYWTAYKILVNIIQIDNKLALIPREYGRHNLSNFVVKTTFKKQPELVLDYKSVVFAQTRKEYFEKSYFDKL